MIMEELEVGRIYFFKTRYGVPWLFERAESEFITYCTRAMDLEDYGCFKLKVRPSFIVYDDMVKELRLANVNEVALWNKMFCDNKTID